MKKPLPVKIVEAIGWTYVALMASVSIMPLLVLAFRGGIELCKVSIVLRMFVVLVINLTFLGMVLDLRRGSRTWFVCQNSFFCLIGVSDMVFHGAARNSDIIGLVSLVLLVGPVVLLYCRQSRQWFAEMAAKSRCKHRWLVCVLCVIFFFIIVFVIPANIHVLMEMEEPDRSGASEEDLRFQQHWNEELRKAREAQSEWLRANRALEPMPSATVPESYNP